MEANGGKLTLHLYWPVLVLLLLIVGSSIGLLALAFWVVPGADAPKLAGVIAQGNSITRVMSLVIVVPAIALLALLDKVEGAAAIAALSAIAGYVLGGTIPSQ
jgi:hypothetical protein